MFQSGVILIDLFLLRMFAQALDLKPLKTPLSAVFRWNNTTVIHAWPQKLHGRLYTSQISADRQIPLGTVHNHIVTYDDPEEWRSASEFPFRRSQEYGPCLVAWCLWHKTELLDGSTGNHGQFFCLLVPEEAMLDLAECRARLRQLPPYDARPFCATVLNMDSDAGRLDCVQDNEENVTRMRIVGPQRASLRAVQEDTRAARCITIQPDWANEEDVEVSLLPEGYEAGTRLLFVHEERLVDATVLSWEYDARPMRHRLHLAGGSTMTVDLNVFNHCQQHFQSAQAYCMAVRSYCEFVRATHARLRDAITGMELRTDDQLLNIGIRRLNHVRREGWTDVKHIAELSERIRRGRANQPVLVAAEAGRGKTWCILQLAFACANTSLVEHDGVPLVPVVVFVQRLVKVLGLTARPTALAADSLPSAPAVLLKYLKQVLPLEEPQRSDWLTMLDQALEMRAVILLLDGLDEAAGWSEWMSLYVREVLVKSGLRVVATSRPEGVPLEPFERQFVILNLEALSAEQQWVAVQTQLAALQGAAREFVQHLSSFTDIRKEHDRVWEAAFESAECRCLLALLCLPLAAPSRFTLGQICPFYEVRVLPRDCVPLPGVEKQAQRQEPPAGGWHNLQSMESLVRVRVSELVEPVLVHNPL